MFSSAPSPLLLLVYRLGRCFCFAEVSTGHPHRSADDSQKIIIRFQTDAFIYRPPAGVYYYWLALFMNNYVLVWMSIFRKSVRNAPNTLRTAVKLTTLGVSTTDVRRDEVEWRHCREKFDSKQNIEITISASRRSASP